MRGIGTRLGHLRRLNRFGLLCHHRLFAVRHRGFRNIHAGRLQPFLQVLIVLLQRGHFLRELVIRHDETVYFGFQLLLLGLRFAHHHARQAIDLTPCSFSPLFHLLFHGQHAGGDRFLGRGQLGDRLLELGHALLLRLDRVHRLRLHARQFRQLVFQLCDLGERRRPWGFALGHRRRGVCRRQPAGHPVGSQSDQGDCQQQLRQDHGSHSRHNCRSRSQHRGIGNPGECPPRPMPETRFGGENRADRSALRVILHPKFDRIAREGDAARSESILGFRKPSEQHAVFRSKLDVLDANVCLDLQSRFSPSPVQQSDATLIHKHLNRVR